MATIVNSRDLALQLGGRARTTASTNTPAAYIELSAPTINKAAVDAATSGVHTNITATGKIETSGVVATGGFLTITANGDTEATTATANTITTSIANGAGKSSYTIKLYSSATVATARILDYKIIPVQFTKVGSGQIEPGSIGTAAFGTNLEPVTVVTTLPSTRVTAAVFYNGRLYYWNGTAYTTQVPANDVGNGLTSAQIADLDATKLTGTIVAARIGSGTIDAGKIASGLELVANSSAGSLPTTYLGELLRWNQKLYRWTGSAYTAAVPAADVGNGLTSAQIADLDAIKLTGSIDSARIGAIIDASKIASGLELVANSSAGSLPTTYLGQLLRWNQKLYRWTGSAYTASVPAADVGNGLTSAQINDLDAAKLSGTLAAARIALNSIAGDRIISLEAAKLSTQILETQIIDGAISTPKIAAGAIIASKIAATSITANKLVVTDSDSVFPDPMFADQEWWNANVGSSTQYSWPTGFIQGSSTVWPTTSALGITATSGYKNSMSREFRIEPEASYRIKFWIYMDSSFAGEITALLHLPNVQWRPLGGVPTSGVMTGDAGIPKINNSALTKNVWLTFEETVTNPTFNNFNNYANLRVAAQVTAGTCYVAVRMVRAANANLIVDGAITTDKMTANTINGDRISGNTLNANKIVAGSITTDRMTANTINGDRITGNTIAADKIVANSITASQIQAGALTATEIASGAISTNKLLVVPQSIIPDAYFTDEAFWTAEGIDTFGWYFDLNPSPLNSPKQAVLWSSHPTNIPGTARKNIYAKRIPLSGPDQVFRFRFKASNNSNQNLYCHLQASKLDGTFLGNIAIAYAPAGVTTATVYETQFSPPTDCAFARVVIYNEAPGTTFTGLMAISDIKLDIAANANLIVDGAITTNKMTANTINGDRITASTLNANKIVAGSITTDRMTANTINGDRITGNTIAADKIVANSITASQIQAGALTATEIASGAITADRLLLVDSTNLTENPTIALGDKGWPIKENGWAYNTIGNEYGGPSMYRNGNATPGAIRNSFLVKAQAGDQFLAQARIYCNVAASSQAYVRVTAQRATSPFEISLGEGYSVNNIATWQTISVNVTFPADYTTCRLEVIAQNTTGTVVLGSVKLLRRNTAELIVDGAITTNKMTANTIDGDRITANTLNASKIVAGTITTDRMTANSISGNIISGGTLAGNKIIAGDISATQLAVGSITASKLKISPANICPDSSFNDTVFWEGSRSHSPGWFLETTHAYLNTRAMTISAAVSGALTGNIFLYSQLINFSNVGKTLRLRARGWNATNRNILVYAEFRNAAGSFLSNFSVQFNAGTGVQTLTAQGSAPDATEQVVFILYCPSGSALTGAGSVTDISLDVAAETSLIVDGAITTNKMTANTIDGDRIAANTLNASKITAGTITTDRMTANSINGDRIIANTLNASKIVSGSITTGKLTVVNNTAVNPDPLYYDPEVWVQATSWTSYMNPAEYNGGGTNTWPQTRALRFTSSGGNFDISSQFFPTEALGYYRTKVYIYISSAFAGNIGVWQHYPSEAWFQMGIPRSGTIHNTLPGINTGLSRDSWLAYEDTFRPGPSTAVNMGFSQFRFAGNITGGEFYIIIQMERSASADLIVDGAITTNKMTANSINADRLSAGTITADKLTIGSRGNNGGSMVKNSDWTDYTGTDTGLAALSQWGQQGTATGAAFGRNWNKGSIYNLGRGGFWITDSEVGGSGEWGIYQQIPYLTPGVTYELHIKGNLHRCGGRITVQYFNSSNAYLGETSVAFTNPGTSSITNDGSYLTTLGWGSGVAPAGTSYGILFILKFKTNAGASPANSYAFFNEVYLAPIVTGASATNPSVYKAQGTVEINGGAILANTITANKITTSNLSSISATIGLLRTATTGQRTEIEDNVIRVYDSSSTLRVKIGNLA